MNNKKININIIDPWLGFEQIRGINESKVSLLYNYNKINKLPFLIKISQKKNSKIVVIGFNSYLKLPNEMKKSTHVVLRPRDIIKYKFSLFKIFKNFTYDLKVYRDLFNTINKDSVNQFDYILLNLRKLSPKFIIITSTIDPVQRLWAFYSKLIGIKVICIQHGIFSSLSAPEILERNIVDYYFSFCEKQSKLIEKTIPIHKHRYIYSESTFVYKIPTSKKIKICLIGTDHERYGLKGKNNKYSVLKIYEQLINLIKSDLKFQYEILYIKHPSEEFIGNIESNVRIIKNNDLDLIDIFFGVASTKLLNMALEHRCTIQISSKEFVQDKYEDYNFCKTIDIQDIEKNGFSFLNNSELVIPCLKKNNFSKQLINIMDDL